jgi:hypothetical protein
VYPRKHEWVTVVDLKFAKDEARIKYFKLEELKFLETAKKIHFRMRGAAAKLLMD